MATRHPDAGRQGRRWAFTYHEYTRADVERIARINCKYIVVGLEVCPTTQRRHMQGYVVFDRPKRLNGVKEALFGRMTHVELAKGTTQQNVEYCKKTRECDDEPNEEIYEFGEQPSPENAGGATRERYRALREQAESGDFESMDADLFVRHYSTLQAIHKDHLLTKASHDDTTLDNEWYYGVSGSGKSYKARTENPGAYLKMCNKWWDGYLGQDVVIIEDFDKCHQVLGYHMKIWADKYPFPCEVKRHAITIRPKKIIVTSNWHPDQIWVEDETLQPILRRFKVTHFSQVFTAAQNDNANATSAS